MATNTPYNTRSHHWGLSVPPGRTGLYGPEDITINKAITVDGQLVPEMSSDTVGADEEHLGVVTAPSDVYEVTLTVPTDAQDANDVIAATQRMKDCVRVPGGTGVLHSMIVLDTSDQAAAIDVYILRSDVALGTEDAAVSITDADAEEILTVVPVAAADYKDLINSQMAQLSGLSRIIKAARGSRDLYIAATTSGTPTYATGEIKIKLGFLWD